MMKKLLLISMFIGALPLSMVAQDDDLYFVPQKKNAEKVTDNYGLPNEVYYSGSDRSIDDYNRRTKSYYEVLDGDSTKNDIINFSSEKGVFPDSISEEAYKLTKKMARFEDYDISDNAAFWAGYNIGRNDWGWHSPWYYSRLGWHGGWYDPWYYGWYDPWYYGYASWYDPWYYGGWGYRSYAWIGVGGGGRYYAPTIGGGTIRRDGLIHGSYGRGSVATRNTSRLREARNRTVGGHMRSGGSVNRGGNSSYGSSRSNGSVNSSFGTSRSGGSYSGGSTRSSGSYSGGGARGGGSRMGGRR